MPPTTSTTIPCRIHIHTHNEYSGKSVALLNGHIDQNTVCLAVRTTANEDEKTPPYLLKIGWWPENGDASDDIMQISVIEGLAKVLGITARTNATVSVLKRDDIASHGIQWVELSIKDTFMSRSDQWRVRTRLVDTCVYLGETISIFPGVFATVRQISSQGGVNQSTGLITTTTHAVFRSRSAKVFVLVQMSREMWEFGMEGNLHYEWALIFLDDLIKRWKNLGATHSVTVVLFSRTCFGSGHATTRDDLVMGHDAACPDCGSDECIVEDYNHTVMDNAVSFDAKTLIATLRTTMRSWANDRLKYRGNKHYITQNGHITSAVHGNVLETLNLVMNEFDQRKHNRDLWRTQRNIVLITPGQGYFLVPKLLCHVTKQRAVNLGIGVDIICLNGPPLHRVPLMAYKGEDIGSYSTPVYATAMYISLYDDAIIHDSASCLSVRHSVERLSLSHSPLLIPPLTLPSSSHVDMMDYDSAVFSTLQPVIVHDDRCLDGIGRTVRSDTITEPVLEERHDDHTHFLGPPSQPITKSLTKRRWVHVSDAYEGDMFLGPMQPNWSVLSEPAMLPLTTDFLPSATELLGSSYTLREYDLIADEDSLYGTDAGALIEEMVNQRLQQGYQLIANEAADAFAAHVAVQTQLRHNDGNLSNISFADLPSPIHGTGHGSIQYCLIRGRHFQIIAYDVMKRVVRVSWFSKNWPPLPPPTSSTYWLSRGVSIGSGETSEPNFQIGKYYHVKQVFAVLDDQYWNSIDDMLLLDRTMPFRYPPSIHPWYVSLQVLPIPLPEWQRGQSDGLKLPADECERRVKSFRSFVASLSEFTGTFLKHPIVLNCLVVTPDANKKYRVIWHENRQIQSQRIDVSCSGDRPEWLVVEFDHVFNPMSAFRIDVSWVVCSATVIEQLVQMLQRKARQANLQVVRVPARRVEVKEFHQSPFRQSLDIPIVDIDASSTTLMADCGFLPEQRITFDENDSEEMDGAVRWLVHRAGGAFCCIADDKARFWVNKLPSKAKDVAVSMGMKAIKCFVEPLADEIVT